METYLVQRLFIVIKKAKRNTEGRALRNKHNPGFFLFINMNLYKMSNSVEVYKETSARDKENPSLCI